VRRIDLAQQLGLAGHETSRDGANIDQVAGRTPVEQRLAEIWADVLGIDPPGIHDNFFQLGGHSLAATQVLARVRQVFQLEVPLRSLFERPTVAAFAELLGQRIASLVAQGRARLQSESSPAAPTLSREAITPRHRASGSTPLSFAQQRLWFLDRLEGPVGAYNMSASLWLTGPLNETALTQSLNEIVRRHETLRTTFPLHGEQPVQAIAPPKQINIPVVDLRSRPLPGRRNEALRLAARDAEHPFDLADSPLIKATLVRLGAEEHVLLLTAHHIVFDGWSVRVLYRELRMHYRAFLCGRASACIELPIQYADFSLWQREWLRGEVLEDQITYWKNRLRNMPPSLRLRTDRIRPAIQTYHGARLQVAIDRGVTEALQDLSRREDVTLFMTLLAAFKTLLLRYTGQDDCQVGVPIANRTRTETEALIGCFANTLVMRTDLSGDPTFAEALGRVREVSLTGYAHQDVPFDKLVAELTPSAIESNIFSR
jgi:acyl carrier protein